RSLLQASLRGPFEQMVRDAVHLVARLAELFVVLHILLQLGEGASSGLVLLLLGEAGDGAVRIEGVVSKLRHDWSLFGENGLGGGIDEMVELMRQSGVASSPVDTSLGGIFEEPPPSFPHLGLQLLTLACGPLVLRVQLAIREIKTRGLQLVFELLVDTSQ